MILNNSGQVFYQNKEILPFYNPFKIVINHDVVSHLQFKEKDALWSINFKKAVASAFQVQGDGPGAFVVNEPSIHGNCTTEYYISNKTEHLSVRKTPELNSCNKVGGIHFQRSNVPLNPCEFDFQVNEIQFSILTGNFILFFENLSIIVHLFFYYWTIDSMCCT